MLDRLSIKCDDEKQTTFHVYLNESQSAPYWKALQQTPTLHSVVIHKGTPRTVEEAVSEIALAIDIRIGGIKAISFRDCCIEDLYELWDVGANHRMSLDFVSCRILNEAAKHLQFMLQSDIMLLDGLSLTSCVLESDAAVTMIADAIRVNRSLRKCECFDMEHMANYIIRSLPDTLKINQNLVRLGLTIDTCQGSNCFWEVCRSAKGSQTLQSLEIRDSKPLNQPSVEAISLLCFTVNSFQELSFHKCSFHRGAMTFLIESLSNNKVIKSLTLEQVTILDSDEQLMTMSCGNLQVEKLNLSGTKFALNSLLQTMKDMANKGCVRTFHVCEDKFRGDLASRYVCDVFLRPNRGPSELVMGELNTHTFEALTAALQQNTSVKALGIPQEMSVDDLARFARGLKNMGGLHRLSLRVSNISYYDGPPGFRAFQEHVEPTETLFRALQRALEQNTTLCQLTIDRGNSTDDITQRYLDRIRFLLTTNLVGRHTLTTAPNVPVGVWAHVLAGSCDVADGIYFALRENPDIVIEANLA